MRPLPGFDGWYLQGRKLRTGEMVEITDVEIEDLALSGDWHPARIVSGGQCIELEGSADAVPGHRGAKPLTISIERLIEVDGHMRRVENPTPVERSSSPSDEDDEVIS